MSLRPRKPLIFFFVLGAVALTGVMIYFFGGREMVSKHESFLVYFDDTMNGVVPGSMVKFKGVPIGYVDSIRLNYRPEGDKRIPVLIQLNVDRLQRQLGVLEDLTNPDVLAAQLRRGLRAELDVESYVTGQMFVELEYHSPVPGYRVAVIPPGLPQIPCIPAVPSESVADMQKIQDIVAWLPTFDFRTEIGAVGAKIDKWATAVSVIPYAEDSQKIQRALRPLVRFNDNAWQRNFDNFLTRFNRYQAALNDANVNFYNQSQGFVSMNRQARGQLEQINAQLADLQTALQPADPAVSNFAHHFGQLAKDLENLTRKLNAVEQQPRILDKAGR